MNEELNNKTMPEETTQLPDVSVETTLPSDVLDEAILLCEEIESEDIFFDEPEELNINPPATKPVRRTTSRTSKKSRFKLYRSLLIAACSVLSVILVLSLTFLIIFQSKAKLIGRESSWKKPSQEEIDAFLDGEKESVPDDALVLNPDDVQWGNIPNPLEANDGIINILLIGLDRRPGETYSRSDSMILCTLNKHTNTLTMTSFLRDMYVQIPGYSDNRINVAYFLGGTKLLNETILLNFGVKIDANVEVDMEGFAACIDVMGGVDVELTQAEAEYIMNRYHRENPDKPALSLSAGMNHLSGDAALIHARDRFTTGNGDFDRTSRQQKIMTAVFNKAKTMSLSEINELLNKLLPHLTTDMTDKEILGYTLAVVSLFDKLELKRARIPADGAYYPAWINSMSVLVPDLEANHKVLAEIMKVN